jgi:predicted RNA binding protein YcfA (HicA-like mRNA interferase family)
MNYKDSAKLAKAYGYQFWRRAKGSHEIWRNSITGETILISTSKRGRALLNFRAELRRKTG